MAAAEGRKTLAGVTHASFEGWAAFAKLHDTDVTALAEVFGLWFRTRDVPLDELNPALRRLVIEAQELHKQRKRRRRGLGRPRHDSNVRPDA